MSFEIIIFIQSMYFSSFWFQSASLAFTNTFRIQFTDIRHARAIFFSQQQHYFLHWCKRDQSMLGSVSGVRLSRNVHSYLLEKRFLNDGQLVSQAFTENWVRLSLAVDPGALLPSISRREAQSSCSEIWGLRTLMAQVQTLIRTWQERRTPACCLETGERGAESGKCM